MSDLIYQLLESFGYRHPLHPVLVHLPIGLNMGALFLGLAARGLRRPEWGRSAYHAIVLACVFAFVALSMGLVDWQHYYNGAWLKPILMKIFIAIPYALMLLLGVVIGYRHGPQAEALLPIYALGVMGVMSLGYFGGELTFTGRSPSAAQALAAGQSLFEANCSSCHPSGGNRIVPGKPILSSSRLASLETFKAHVRDPKLAAGSQSIMPAFASEKLPDADVAKLYDYIQLYLTKPDCVPTQTTQSQPQGGPVN